MMILLSIVSHHGHDEAVIHVLLLAVDVGKEALEIAHKEKDYDKNGLFNNCRFDKALAVKLLYQGLP